MGMQLLLPLSIGYMYIVPVPSIKFFMMGRVGGGGGAGVGKSDGECVEVMNTEICFNTESDMRMLLYWRDV